MALSTRSRIGVTGIGVLMTLGGLMGPAKASPPPKTAACPSGAVGIFMDHFNSQHLGKTLFGAGSITEDPAGWTAAHEVLFASMASKAAGSC